MLIGLPFSYCWDRFKLNPETNLMECQLDVLASGTWKYFVRSSKHIYDSAVFQIPPRLTLQDKPVPLESICLLSVISKWIGPINEWGPFMDQFKSLGYNMIHFTPLQKRGLSNSPYSIYNHLELSSDLFPEESHGFVEVEQDAATKEMSLKGTVSDMENSGLLSMIDIVWNHISCDSPLLAAHPDLGYNLDNSPHLKIAYDLDEGILDFSREIESVYGVNPNINTEPDIHEILRVFREVAIPKLNLWEYFVINVSKHVQELEDCVRNKVCHLGTSPEPYLEPAPSSDLNKIKNALKFDHKYGRFSHFIDMRVVHDIYASQIEDILHAPSELERSVRLSKLLTNFRTTLDAVNYDRYRIYDEKVHLIIRNLASRLKYERLDSHGPRLGPINSVHPLVSTYFTRIIDNNGNKVALANNGWIWNADPLVNFAEAPSEAYFLRDVIIWGDCVKLRYGQSPKDNPWLWEYMAEYTQKMANIFHAFRIDNCHSTPIHVAEYLLDRAREVRPELYVCAELFTGSPERDMQFISVLGLNSLIREAMATGSPGDLGRNTVEYGGQSLGSFQPTSEYHPQKGELNHKIHSKPHALFADCTHDNETPGQRRLAVDALPNAAVVAMSVCATASVLGYDLLVPKHINIVKDNRRFMADHLVNKGIGKAKLKLNELHQRMAVEGYTQIYGDESAGVITLVRENPATLQSYFLLSHQGFGHWTSRDFELEFEGFDVKVVMTARLQVTGNAEENGSVFTGFPCVLEMAENGLLEGLGWVETKVESGRTKTKLHIRNFMPGSIIMLHRSPDEVQDSAYQYLDGKEIGQDLEQVLDTLSLGDLNVILYRCEAEEQDSIRIELSYMASSNMWCRSRWSL